MLLPNTFSTVWLRLPLVVICKDYGQGRNFYDESLSNENVTVRILHIFQIMPLRRFHTAKIIDRPVSPLTTVEIVVCVSHKWSWEKHWPTTPWIAITRWNWGRCWRLQTLVTHTFDDLTTDTPFLPINQTSCSWKAYQPVVYVALDQDLSAKLFPQREIHGIVVYLAQWWSCWYGNISFPVRWPVRSWCDCIWIILEIIIISEGIAPH